VLNNDDSDSNLNEEVMWKKKEKIHYQAPSEEER
jgi:hypothetical protein